MTSLTPSSTDQAGVHRADVGRRSLFVGGDFPDPVFVAVSFSISHSFVSTDCQRGLKIERSILSKVSYRHPHFKF
jgi:hypothetical protein